MDRQTIAQAVALLIVLGALVRWLPAPGQEGPVREVEQTDPLGRGMPWEILVMDVRQATRAEDPTAWLARMLGATRPAVYTPRFYQMLGLTRRIRENATPDQLVQLRNVARNESWIAAYYLYPLRVVGAPGTGRDEAPPLPEADWIVRGGDIVTAARGEQRSEPFELERAP
ncbi:MAG: hypothetical protein ACYTG2_05155 [Planctomycetota bacterium]|jgi:hypothetical protein